MPYNPKTAKKRWNISLMQKYRKFCGWQTLLEMIELLDMDTVGPHGERLFKSKLDLQQAEGLIATTFENGARICEVIGQEKEDGVDGVKIQDFTVQSTKIVAQFEIEKRYRKVGRKVIKYKAVDRSHLRWDTLEGAQASERPFEEYEGYNTERVIALRTFDYPIQEPLVPIMLKWRETVKDLGREKLFDLTYNNAYRIIKAAGAKLGLDFPPHRLRAERATQLRLEAKMTSEELKQWFNWKSLKEAINYTTLAPLTQAKMYNIEYLEYLKSLEVKV